jgi:hypothetical protein
MFLTIFINSRLQTSQSAKYLQLCTTFVLVMSLFWFDCCLSRITNLSKIHPWIDKNGFQGPQMVFLG